MNSIIYQDVWRSISCVPKRQGFQQHIIITHTTIAQWLIVFLFSSYFIPRTIQQNPATHLHSTRTRSGIEQLFVQVLLQTLANVLFSSWRTSSCSSWSLSHSLRRGSRCTATLARQTVNTSSLSTHDCRCSRPFIAL